jgi:hypothetical protein
MVMAAKLGLERLFCWVWRRPDAPAVDPADMGTAFGMEMSFDVAENGNTAHDGPKATPKLLPRRGAE